jgi:hypothetical protein
MYPNRQVFICLIIFDFIFNFSLKILLGVKTDKKQHQLTDFFGKHEYGVWKRFSY